MAKPSTPTLILGGLVLGAVAGVTSRAAMGPKNPSLQWIIDNLAKPGGDIFLYLLFMTVVPLLFSALVLGIGELGDAVKVGKIGMYALAMTVLFSGTAVVIGLAGVNLVKPGEKISSSQQQALKAEYFDAKKAKEMEEKAAKKADDPPVLGFIPQNPVKEAARAMEGGLLPLMFFALVFGIALGSIESERAAPVRAILDGTFAACQKIIGYAMKYGPIGVFCLVFRSTATLGPEVFIPLSAYVVLVLAALAIHMFGTYSLALKYIARRSPVEFFRQMKTVMLTAFATSSSNATLPTALDAATKDVGLPRDVSAFVLTVGATANQNGTALFEGITIVFLAQLMGVPLDLGQQLTVMGLAIVAGIGTAGIPGGAWPMIATVLAMFKVPPESIGIVLGIDRILDMSRTVLNVTGDMAIAACVARLNGEPAEVPVVD
jgi:DAACS family dicarboxylate/amino acid:cation (Na+ or H+) symporter